MITVKLCKGPRLHTLTVRFPQWVLGVGASPLRFSPGSITGSSPFRVLRCYLQERLEKLRKGEMQEWRDRGIEGWRDAGMRDAGMEG